MASTWCYGPCVLYDVTQTLRDMSGQTKLPFKKNWFNIRVAILKCLWKLNSKKAWNITRYCVKFDNTFTAKTILKGQRPCVSNHFIILSKIKFLVYDNKTYWLTWHHESDMYDNKFLVCMFCMYRAKWQIIASLHWPCYLEGRQWHG